MAVFLDYRKFLDVFVCVCSLRNTNIVSATCISSEKLIICLNSKVATPGTIAAHKSHVVSSLLGGHDECFIRLFQKTHFISSLEPVTARECPRTFPLPNANSLLI